MKTVAASAVIALLAISLCEGKPRHCALRVHTEANANGGPVFTAQILVAGKAVTVDKIPAISEQDVVAFQVYPAADGTHGVLLQLNEHGRLALNSLSIERRGSSLFIFVNGRVITELQIDQRVSDGKIYIASGLTTNDIELMKKDWRLLGPGKK
ncbi:MAG TPA: hypothetical protein VN921_04725 [Chthoniobacterales bacterium]|nr:hypothetical protein [Chthoniobacterales bacterium]